MTFQPGFIAIVLCGNVPSPGPMDRGQASEQVEMKGTECEHRDFSSDLHYQTHHVRLRHRWPVRSSNKYVGLDSGQPEITLKASVR